MEESVRELDIKVYSKDKNLLSHDQGVKILEHINRELIELPEGGILIINFQGIKYATAVCLKEMLAALNTIRQGKFGDKYIVLKLSIANRNFRECLTLTLQNEEQVVLCLDENEDWQVIGKLTKSQNDTFQLIRQHKEVNSNQLSLILDIPINAASNRLKALYDMRIVARAEKILRNAGGRQFIYKSIF